MISVATPDRAGRHPDAAALAGLERSLAAVLRLLADRDTLGDIATRSGHDLPPASWSLLEYLDDHGALRVSDIAACHGVDISSVTPRLKSLERAQLVSRHGLPTDARVSMIAITPTGRTALDAVHAARREIIAHALRDVGAAQLTDAARVLELIAGHMSTAAQRLAAGAPATTPGDRPRHC